jgi:hypothetical protein
MPRLSFSQARAILTTAGFQYLGTACIADCDTSYWAHPVTLTLAAIRGWDDDYTPRHTLSTYHALVRVVMRILSEREHFVPDATLEHRAQTRLAALGFGSPARSGSR